VGTVKVSHERWGEMETSIFHQKKMKLDILILYIFTCVIDDRSVGKPD
jgi:hypothetical protein